MKKGDIFPLLLIIFLLTGKFVKSQGRFEKGNALYIRGDFPSVTVLFGHTGLYWKWEGENSEDDESHFTIESIGGPPWKWKYSGPTITNFQKFLEGRGEYMGAFTLPNVNYDLRKKIVEIAEDQADGEPPVGYAFFWGYKQPNKTFRCDGLVEYCYEIAYGEPWEPGNNKGIVINDKWYTLWPFKQMSFMVLEEPKLEEITFHKQGIVGEGEAITPSRYESGRYYVEGKVKIKFYVSDGEKGSGIKRAEVWLGEPDDTPNELPGKRIFRDDKDYDIDHIYVFLFDTSQIEPGEYTLFAVGYDQAGNFNKVSIPIVIERKGAIFKDKDNWDGKQIWYGSGTYWDAGVYIRSNSKYYKEDRSQVDKIGNGYLYPEFTGEGITREFGYNVNFIRCIRSGFEGYDENGMPIIDERWLNIIENSPTPFEDSYRYLLSKRPKFYRGLPYEIGNGYIVSDAAGQFYTGDMLHNYPGDEVLITRHFLQFPIDEKKTIYKIKSNHYGCYSYGNSQYFPFYVGVCIFNSDIDIGVEEEGEEEGGLKELFEKAGENVRFVYAADGYGINKNIFRDLKAIDLQEINKGKKYIYISVMKVSGGNSLGDEEDLTHNQPKQGDIWGEFCRYGRQNYVDVGSAFISNYGSLTLYYSKKSYWISLWYNIPSDKRSDDKIIITGVEKEGKVKLYIRFKEKGEKEIEVENENYKEGWIDTGELQEKVIDGESLGYKDWERFQICLEFLEERSKVDKFEVKINER
ncbi:MAG: hypothetical protein ACP5OB_03755 [Candidatus Ratteibacteria bacterium]